VLGRVEVDLITLRVGEVGGSAEADLVFFLLDMGKGCIYKCVCECLCVMYVCACVCTRKCKCKRKFVCVCVYVCACVCV
jgi:hypothetical protein